MAKLSVRGRVELLRLERRTPYKDYNGVEHADPPCFSRTSYAFMSDGAILRKHDWRGPQDYRPYPGRWTVVSKRPPLEPAALRASGPVQTLLAKGFSEVPPRG